MKKVLTIHFSQSGQLTEIVTNFTNELKGVEIENQLVVPVDKFPFPWTTPVFFDKMPETVLEIPIEIEDIQYNHEKYDLIILGYQPWFLSPSMPITAILNNEKFKTIVKDTPVITLIGSRNMWLNSQESIKSLLKKSDGRLVGNVVLADKSSNLVGVVTILHWMLKGEKTRKWGIFPKPGVSDEDIQNVGKFGVFANKALESADYSQLQNQIIEHNGAYVNTNILFIEERAKKLFVIWANLILKKAKNGKRSFWVNAFKYYLIFVLFVVSPILLLIFNLLILPFTFSSVKKKKRYFQHLELK